jgi:hypothetical protein
MSSKSIWSHINKNVYAYYLYEMLSVTSSRSLCCTALLCMKYCILQVKKALSFYLIFSTKVHCFSKCRKWVSYSCWTPTQQFFSYIMARTSSFSMRWWWGSLCTRPTRLVGFFSAKHAALRRKSKDWLAPNQDNVSEWSHMSLRGLLFQWATTIKIQLSMLV